MSRVVEMMLMSNRRREGHMVMIMRCKNRKEQK